MRRWNGWGEPTTVMHLPPEGAAYLKAALGPGAAPPDAAFEHVLASVPATRLPPHPLVDTGAEVRLLHARGQSLPDWVALRSGHIEAFPDGVAFPESDEQVRALLAYAQECGARLIPYGGGTSVVGHINPLPGPLPTLTLDLARLNRLLDLDRFSGLATFGAGVRGPDLEAALAEHGLTLGHFPQSFELSTLGGWIASRSSGQQSYHYGRIEDHFAGGHVETLRGPLDLPPFPASAAGPDLRHLLLGSEGRLGVITRAVIRVRPRPQAERFYGVFFREWQAGAAALRAMAQARLDVSMLRLSDARETEVNLVLSGKPGLVRWADRGLRLAGYGAARCLLLYGVTGEPEAVRRAGRQVAAVTRAHGGLPPIGAIGSLWRRSRFLTPYLRNTLWDHGYAIDTLETAAPWSAALPLVGQITAALEGAAATQQTQVLVFAHLSHIYADGASSYITYLFPRRQDPGATLALWQAMKQAASQAVVAGGGTISHQHGIGLDHAPYLEAEKGALGMGLLRAACRELDPQGLLNPGKLLTD